VPPGHCLSQLRMQHTLMWHTELLLAERDIYVFHSSLHVRSYHARS
jgi:hypothetical protein